MSKIRVYELAKQLNMTNKVLLDKLEEMNCPAKSHMSVLEDELVDKVKMLISGKKSEVVDESRVRTTVIRRRKREVSEAQAQEQESSLPLDEEIHPADTDTAAVVDATDQQLESAIEEETEASVIEEAVALSSLEQSEQAERGEPAAVSPTETSAAESFEPEVIPSRIVERKVKKTEAAKIIRLPEQKPVAPPAPAPASAPAPVRESVAPRERPRRTEFVPVPAEILIPGIESEKSRAEGKGKPKKKIKKSGADEDDLIALAKKKAVFQKKEVWERSDLYGDSASRPRRRQRKEKSNVRVSASAATKTLITTPKAIKRRIRVDEFVLVSELAKRMGIKGAEVVKRLMNMGVMATLNQSIDFDTAVVVAGEFEYEVEKAAFEELDMIGTKEEDPSKLKLRPPVVTIMGHVDHGKTSLLDAIRKTNVIAGEAGGITQHIGAYQVAVGDHMVAFLDTPGHEAFTAMRARGAEVTDLVVLVVAADDGVMPQTVEAINHARAAEVPILVAVNKIDKPEADPDRVKRQLAEQGLSPEEWGGETIYVHVSAKKGTGIDSLLEMILLQAEVLELKANPDARAMGHVVEAKIDPGRGPVATVLVQEGTLRAGDHIVAGWHYGKVRAMNNDWGKRINSAGPSAPVEILGLSGVPMAGDEFAVLRDEKQAKQVAAHRSEKQRIRTLARSSRVTLEGYHDQMKGGFVKDLTLIVRADVQGSIEALVEALGKIPSKEVKVNVVHSATGAITESDIMLAAVSHAIVVGFNVRPNQKVNELANDQGVDVRFYDIIYNVINDIKGAMAGLMDPTFEERILGRAEVRDTFVVKKVGTIAGCHVIDGKLERGRTARLIRDGIVVYQGKIGSLRRFKDDVKEVLTGYECGLGIENYNDIKAGDVVECFHMEEIAPVLK